MERIHNLLRRQIRRHFNDSFSIAEDWQGFFDAVNSAYWESDADRGMLERALELSSQELLQTNSEMRAFIQALPDEFLWLDHEGTVTGYKAGGTTNPHPSMENLVGRRIQDIALVDVGNKFNEVINRVREKGSITSIEYSLVIEGHERFYEARLLPLLDNQIFAVIRDITGRKQIEEELRKHRDHLEEMVKERTAELKKANEQLQLEITERKQLEKEMARLERLNAVGEMAAGIGHEIRNPMTTVRGFLQILGSKEDCIKYKEYYELMIEELDRANSILTEYLSLAKNKTVEKRLKNVNDILEAVLPLIQSDAIKDEKNIILELWTIPDLFFDEKEIRQLILNLVRNGLEAMSPGGNLTIKTFTDGNEAVLAVQDQGKGIEPEVLEKIGTPFYTTKDNGTGLGLAVCYSIAARHNAKIEIETGSNGTTFLVRFKQYEE